MKAHKRFVKPQKKNTGKQFSSLGLDPFPLQYKTEMASTLPQEGFLLLCTALVLPQAVKIKYSWSITLIFLTWCSVFCYYLADQGWNHQTVGYPESMCSHLIRKVCHWQVYGCAYQNYCLSGIPSSVIHLFQPNSLDLRGASGNVSEHHTSR